MPRNYRAESGGLEVPSELSEVLFGARLKVAELGLDAWQDLTARELSNEDRQQLMSFLYQLPVPESRIAKEGGIPPSWLYSLPISPRSRNALKRHFSTRTAPQSSLNPITCGEFLRIRGIGKTALIELMCVMESAEREYSGEPAPAEELPRLITMTESQFQTAVYEASDRILQASDPLSSKLVNFAAWAQSETDARTLGEAIAVSSSRPVPSESWQEISKLEISEIARAPSHPYDIIESWVADLPGRDRFIFQHRVASPARSHTLQEIADSLSLSRERVRQVEKRVLSKFAAFTRKNAASQVKWRIETLRQLVGVAAPVSQVETLLRPNDIRMDYSQLLLKMAGSYEIVGDWIVSRAAMANDPTQSVIDMG